MFLEKCGHLFFLKMRPIFFFTLVIFPLILSSLFLSQKSSQLQVLEDRFAAAARKEKLALARKGRKERFLARYSNSNPYFLDQEIESFAFLQSEKRKLESLLHHPAFPESQAIKDRLSFLSENRLLFSEEKMEVSAHLKEIGEKQRRPVQMDESDLQQILTLIEDLPRESMTSSSKRPQLLIKEFRLKKQETPLQTEVFEVEMDLLKREFNEL